jgi:hypothetical protein
MFDYTEKTITTYDTREPVIGYQEFIGDIEALSQDIPGLDLSNETK